MKSYSYRLFLLLLSLAAFADQTNTAKPSFVQKCKDHKLKIALCTVTGIAVIFFTAKRLNDKAFKKALADFRNATNPTQNINRGHAAIVDVQKAKGCAKKLMDTCASWFASSKNKKDLLLLQNSSSHNDYFKANRPK